MWAGDRETRLLPKRRPPEATTVAVVVPCYDEQAVLPSTLDRLRGALDGWIADGRVAPDSHVTFVDDGSRDETWALITAAHLADPRMKGMRLSRNHGHQNALLAGLLLVEADAVVSLDADLQDDPDVIPRMLDAYHAGAEVVCGVRIARDVDSTFKRTTARLYYRLLSVLGVEVIPDHADFRLLGAAAVDALREFGETRVFLRAIVPLLGFPTATIPYRRLARAAGETRYPLHKMVALAANGLAAFSSAPLQWILPLGALLASGAAAVGAVAVAAHGTGVAAVPAWVAAVIPLYVLGGVQLVATGLVAVYLARVYDESKRRPRFIVSERLK